MKQFIFVLILIIAILLWRKSKKKKKAAQKAKPRPAAKTPAPPAAAPKTAPTPARPAVASAKPSAPQNADPNASLKYEVELHFKGFPIYTPEVKKTAPRRGTPVSENDLPKTDFNLVIRKGGNENPDFDFACARKLFDKYTEKWKAGRFDIDPASAEAVKNWIRESIQLARYYESGWGCDRDVNAALEVLLDLDKYMSRQAGIEGRGKETEEETNAFHAGAEAWLALGECYACLGETQKSQKYYRMAMAASRMDKYPEFFESEILNSTLGGYPVPANPMLAMELALKLVQQDKAYAGYTVLEARDLLKMDYQKIGQSYEQDFQVYLAAGRKDGSGYAAYKLGECYLYGIGTEQNVYLGLSLLHDASYSKSLNATKAVHEYLEGLHFWDYRGANGKKLSSSQQTEAAKLQVLWDERVDNMKEDTHILSIVQNIIDKHAGAEDLLGKRAKPAAAQAAQFDDEDDYETEDTAEAPYLDFPWSIDDDYGRRWSLDWGNGDEARYTLDAEFDQKADLADSLIDGVAYLKKSDLANGRATYHGLTFHW